MSKKDIKEMLYNLKVEAASELNMLDYIKENNDHDKSEYPSRVNGSQGGPIGGRMVRKMIEAEKQRMLGK